MNTRKERVEWLQKSFADAVRLSRSRTAPALFLTVVDRYGELMVSNPESITLSDRESREFSIQFGAWLRAVSREMDQATLGTVVRNLELPSGFSGQFLLFTTLDEFAEWYLEQESEILDAYTSNYINEGFPIYTVSLFTDRFGKRRLRGKRN